MPDFRMKEDIHKNIKYINNKLGDENWVPLQINSLIREGMLSDGVGCEIPIVGRRIPLYSVMKVSPI